MGLKYLIRKGIVTTVEVETTKTIYRVIKERAKPIKSSPCKGCVWSKDTGGTKNTCLFPKCIYKKGRGKC